MTGRVKLELLKTGVPGLDYLMGGGLPTLSLNIICGEPGCGKTTLAQHIMFSLATPERRALYFTTLGEPSIKMLRYQQQFDYFDFDKIDSAIRFVNLSGEMQNENYNEILAVIVEQTRLFEPSLIFIDSFRTVIHHGASKAQPPAGLQAFVQQLAVLMANWQTTSFLTGDYHWDERGVNPIFTICDGIIWLSQHVFRNAMMRRIQVIKMRGVAQSPGSHTFRISRKGIEIFPRALTPPDAATMPAQVVERLSTGVAELDRMLGGGVPRGCSVLLSGPSASGKTMLATEFLREGVRQGDSGIIALFEKSARQMANDPLRSMIRGGQVGMLNMRLLDLSFDETLAELVRMIDAQGAHRVVLDSLSGFELALAPEFREDFRESLYRMIATLTSKGVTIMMVTEYADHYDALRFSPYGSAFLADVIIMQRFFELAGQLRTLISVIKVSGSAHSRDLRSFEVTDSGFVIGEQALPYQGLLSGGRSDPEPQRC